MVTFDKVTVLYSTFNYDTLPMLNIFTGDKILLLQILIVS